MAERDNRSAQVHLRLTANEAARMRERAEASGLGLSAYIRRAALSGGVPAPAADARELRPLYAELRRCGSNVNQIARALNT
uniref:plasmid mobilization protein n=1 Tax=Collinsella tanakaei TaxID=626935 RepID=UPI0026EF0AEC